MSQSAEQPPAGFTASTASTASNQAFLPESVWSPEGWRDGKMEGGGEITAMSSSSLCVSSAA